jgi:F-type H+-transporting ATPase subunit epsilon
MVMPQYRFLVLASKEGSSAEKAPVILSDKEFRCLVITAQGKSFDDNVVFVSASGSEGELGILSQHTPMIAVLTTGILKIQTKNQVHYFALDSGMLEVKSGSHDVLILADRAEPASSRKEAIEKVLSFVSK